jgi:hypothetical protein
VCIRAAISWNGVFDELTRKNMEFSHATIYTLGKSITDARVRGAALALLAVSSRVRETAPMRQMPSRGLADRHSPAAGL